MRVTWSRLILPGTAVGARHAEQAVGAGAALQLARPLELGGGALVILLLHQLIAALHGARGVGLHHGFGGPGGRRDGKADSAASIVRVERLRNRGVICRSSCVVNTVLFIFGRR